MTEVRRELDRIEANINDTYAAIEAAGGAVPAAKTSDNLPSTVANALANAGEDLDAVLDEQAALISQIATDLDGKAAGGGTAKKTVTVTVTNNCSYPVYYVNDAGELCKIIMRPAAQTAEALGGILYYRQALDTITTGACLKYATAVNGLHYATVFVFMEDGGTMRCLEATSGGD